MDAAHLRTPLYWPGLEFMYLVLTTSTGEAMTVVHNPAPKADTKWQGRLSVGQKFRVRVPRGKGNLVFESGLLWHLSGEWTWAECPWLNRRSPALCNSQSHFWRCLEQFLHDRAAVNTQVLSTGFRQMIRTNLPFHRPWMPSSLAMVL